MRRKIERCAHEPSRQCQIVEYLFVWRFYSVNWCRAGSSMPFAMTNTWRIFWINVWNKPFQFHWFHRNLCNSIFFLGFLWVYFYNIFVEWNRIVSRKCRKFCRLCSRFAVFIVIIRIVFHLPTNDKLGLDLFRHERRTRCKLIDGICQSSSRAFVSHIIFARNKREMTAIHWMPIKRNSCDKNGEKEKQFTTENY